MPRVHSQVTAALQPTMDILSALNILRTASDDALKCHAAETISTLQKVGERLRANLLPGTPCDSVSERSASLFGHPIADTPSPPNSFNAVSSSSPGHVTTCEPSPRDSCSGASHDKAVRSGCDISAPVPPVTVPPPKKVLPSNDLVSKLGRAIRKTVPWIWETSNKDINFVISCKRKSGEDHRLEHIRRVEGDPESDEKEKLLRLLAIRSLASEFTTEQSLLKPQTKVDELVAYVYSVEAGTNEHQPDSKGRRSDVSDFVERHSRISTAAKLANGAINNGIKHLVFEEVLRNRLRERGLPDMSEAVSAILGLNMNNFRSLPYRRMPDLLDVLLADDMKVSLQREGEPDNERSVVEIIWGLNSWFTDLRAEYNSE